MLNRKIFAVALSCVTGWSFTYLATNVFKDYRWGLFVWLPAVMGAICTLVFGYKKPFQTKKTLRNTSFLALLIFCLGLLVFAWEGIICLIMAAPIGLFFNWVGYRIGLSIIKNKMRATPTIVVLLFISVSAFMSFESIVTKNDKLRAVTTSIEINASPEQVWQSVIAFPQLKDPKEFIFRTGIAYPINATIEGSGIGAVRHCNFSTGSFTEPIVVWDEPRLLRFTVIEQPEPLKEISLYNIHPNHLHGYWISKQGQFKLVPLTNGHTLLVGTTWYTNKIEPGFYWAAWSDYIVHKIHKRVLEHIKLQAELQR